MISILRATENDCDAIVAIGQVSVADAHRESCAAEVLQEFIEENYNNDAIKKELWEEANIYHIIYYNGQPAGFSKIVLNAPHATIVREDVTKLDRIYLLKEFHNLKLGYKLLKFNIELSKNSGQSGLWLFTWIGNKKAIDFYTRAGFTIIGRHNFYIAKTHYNPNYQMFVDFATTGGCLRVTG